MSIRARIGSFSTTVQYVTRNSSRKKKLPLGAVIVLRMTAVLSRKLAKEENNVKFPEISLRGSEINAREGLTLAAPCSTLFAGENNYTVALSEALYTYVVLLERR